MWNIEKIVKKGDYLYAVVHHHPNASKYGYVLLHRIIMENHLGRLLNTNEVVHHKDKNKFNNDVKNLEVMDVHTHARLHAKENPASTITLKCPWCSKIFTRQRKATWLEPSKQSKFKCTCCSRSCRGKLFREIQLHGITHKLEVAISENILTDKAEDNSEVTE